MNLRIVQTADLEACLALRYRVFVIEQNVPVEIERDADDANALHILATKGGVPVGAARIVLIGETAKIGRVCVLADQRGTGLGKLLMDRTVKIASQQEGITQAKLGAQTYAIGFYEALGFTAYGPVYLDANIEHSDMVLEF